MNVHLRRLLPWCIVFSVLGRGVEAGASPNRSEPIRLQTIELGGFGKQQAQRLTGQWPPHWIRQMEKGGRGQEFLNVVAVSRVQRGAPADGAPWQAVPNYTRTNRLQHNPQWVHLANTYDGITQRVYVNGRLAKSRSNAGNLFVGEKGMICCSSHGGAPVLLSETRRKEFTLPAKTLPRPTGGIMGDLLNACKAGGGPTFSGCASFSGPFLEMLLVGHLAMRAGLNKPVEWDGVNMKATNRPELSQYVTREYRKGWTL